MKKFQEMLMKDLGWKLLSVAIAATMWFMVININQPNDTRTYSKNITLENIQVLTERGLTVGNAADLTGMKVSIKIKAQRTALDRLSQSTDWLKASVDLTPLAYAVAGDVVTLPVDVPPVAYGVYNIISKTPAVVEVRVERQVAKEIPVTITMNGEVTGGLTYSAPKISNETVLVRGPSSAVEKVVSVKGTVSAQEIMANSQARVKVTAVDAAGTPVKGITTSVSEVTVTYDLSDSKKVPIKVNVTGTPEAGFSMGEITCTPQTIEVTGSPEALERLMFIQTEAIDISGATAAVKKVFNIMDYLPQGIKLKDTNNTTAQVQIAILGNGSREMVIPVTGITLVGQEENKEYALSENGITVLLSGDAAALAALSEEKLTATVNVSALTEGAHMVAVTLGLPQGITAEAVSVKVTVTQTPEEVPQEPVEE